MEPQEQQLNSLLKQAHKSERKAWRLTTIFSLIPILFACTLVVYAGRLLVGSQNDVSRLNSELGKWEQESNSYKKQVATLTEELEMKKPDLFAYKTEIESLRLENQSKNKEVEKYRKLSDTYKEAYVVLYGDIGEIDKNLRQVGVNKKLPQIRESIEVIEGAKKRAVDFP